jgi:hypothetical protein
MWHFSLGKANSLDLNKIFDSCIQISEFRVLIHTFIICLGFKALQVPNVVGSPVVKDNGSVKVNNLCSVTLRNIHNNLNDIIKMWIDVTIFC